MKKQYLIETMCFPMLADMYNAKKIVLDNIANISYLGRAINIFRDKDFNLEDLSITYMKDDNGNFYILFKRPESCDTQFKYMAFVLRGASQLNLNDNEGVIKYYTLEKSSDSYKVCSRTKNSCSNCGSLYGEPSAEEFLENLSLGSRLTPAECVKIPKKSKSTNSLMWKLIPLLIVAAIIAFLMIK